MARISHISGPGFVTAARARRSPDDHRKGEVSAAEVAGRRNGPPQRRRAGSTASRWVLILVTVAGLAADAYFHWQLAPRFDTLIGAASPYISQGQLFRVEAASAVVAILVLLLTRNRLGALVAFLVAAGGLAALLVYAFVDVGGFGPLPDMYDPTWYAEKTVTAVAEAVAAIAALWLLLLKVRTNRS
ncbi:MAG: hypothetical protein HY829_04780 [Actinobacteria bacterium]|nr:hypothetical protein [Actinomycetota bacterium]